jgi:hypothetical protein
MDRKDEETHTHARTVEVATEILGNSARHLLQKKR